MSLSQSWIDVVNRAWEQWLEYREIRRTCSDQFGWTEATWASLAECERWRQWLKGWRPR